MNPTDRNLLAKQVAEDVQKRLHQQTFGAQPGESKGQPHVLKSGMGLPDFGMPLSALVSSALDLTVQLLGTSVENLVLKDRDAIRSLATDRVWQFLDGLIHDVMGGPLPVPTKGVPAPKGAPGSTVGPPAPKGRGKP
jgi:hypothetical protein